MDELKHSNPEINEENSDQNPSPKQTKSPQSVTIAMERQLTVPPQKTAKWYKDKNVWRILIVLTFTLGFMVAEILVGILTGSLALLSDAFHMLSDGLGLIIGLIALLYTKKKYSETFSYGWVRAEIIGGLINGTFLISSTVYITIEAIQRFIKSEEVTDPLLIVWIGLGGLGVNILGMILFAGHSGLKVHFHAHSHKEKHEHRHGHQHRKKKRMKKKNKRNHLENETSDRQSGPFDEKTDSKKSGRYHKNQKEKEKSDIESGSDSLSSLDSDLDAKPSPNIRGDHSENSIQMSTLSNVSNPTMNDDIEHTLENTQEERDDNDDNDNDDDDDDNDDDDDGDGNGDDNQTKGQKKKRKTSKNLRALFLHLLGDALGSLGAIGAGLSIHFFTFPERYYFDPIVSLLISALILRGAIPLVKSCIAILMQSVPHTLNLENLKAELEQIPGVAAIHELHVWSLSDDKMIGSVHVLCLKEASFTKIVSSMKDIFHKYEIHSSTIQPEYVSIRTLKEKKQFKCHYKCNRECDPENACCPLKVDILTDEEVNSILLKSQPGTLKRRRHKRTKEKLPLTSEQL